MSDAKEFLGPIAEICDKYDLRLASIGVEEAIVMVAYHPAGDTNYHHATIRITGTRNPEIFLRAIGQGLREIEAEAAQ